MATFLDVTGLQHFTNIFVFLFVWIVVYAILAWTKVLGENHFMHALIGLLLGIFVLISPISTDIVSDIAPFIAVIFLLVVFFLIAMKMLGTDFGEFPALRSVFIFIVVMIIIVSAGVKIRDKAQIPSEPQKDLSKTVNLIFHPTFLGAVLVFAIAIFTIALLASKSA